MMPEYGLGFWQCKLRYQTQEELLEVAREYHRRGLKVDVIVADFFHWPAEGDWKFDKDYWPDPAAVSYTHLRTQRQPDCQRTFYDQWKDLSAGHQ